MRKFLLIFAVLCFMVVSCTSKKGIYYWGDYSESLFTLKQDPNDENLEKHKKVIQEIIEESNDMGKKVPPGIYCEYGYIFAKEGNTKEAQKYYVLEAKTYPESIKFMKLLISNL